MISESPNLPRVISPEDRFIFSLKNELRKHAQEINKMDKALSLINLDDITVDLSGYYTKEEIDSAIQAINDQVVAYGYATESYVQDYVTEQIGQIDVGDQLPEWVKRIKIVNGKLCQRMES